MPRPSTRHEKSWSRGWVLLEVMAAIAIAGLLVGPLAGAVISSAGLAARSRDQAGAFNGVAIGTNQVQAWRWGSCVLNATWTAGPSLGGQASLEPDATGAEVGVWMDGWFAGSWPLDSPQTFLLESAVWEDHEGAEAVIRVHGGDGSWGAPWRLLVPGFDGVVSTEAPVSAEEGSVVAHAPSAASPVFEVSWQEEPLVPLLPAVRVTPVMREGHVAATLDGAQQSWHTEAGRDLDIFF